MAETAQEYPRFPLPNELESLGGLGQPGLYVQHGQHGPQSFRMRQQEVRHISTSSANSRRQPNMVVGTSQGPVSMQGTGVAMQGTGVAMQGTGVAMQGTGVPMQGRPTGVAMQGTDIEFPPDVAAMMLSGGQQKMDIDERHHDVIHRPHGSTEIFTQHQKRSDVQSMYENQAVVSFTTEHFDSTAPPDDTASEDHYDLRLVGAADVERGGHLGYAKFKVGAETTSEDSLSSFTQSSQHHTLGHVSTQNQHFKYGSLRKTVSDSGNVPPFSQHLAKLGSTEIEAVSLESLASFTQQQAKEWEDSPSEDSSFEHRQMNVGVTSMTETTTRHASDMAHTLPLQKSMYNTSQNVPNEKQYNNSMRHLTTSMETTTRHANDMVHTLPPQKFTYSTSQNLPNEKQHYSTMHHLTSESNVHHRQQDVPTSHMRAHSTPAFQETDTKDQNRKIKEYFSYDLRPGVGVSPASSVGSSRIDVTMNISDQQQPKVQSETVERTTATTMQMMPGSTEQNVPRRPPPPVMPKPPKTPEQPRDFNYTERLTIRTVIPRETQSQTSVTERVIEQGYPDDSNDVTSDVFDSDVEVMMTGPGMSQQPKQDEEPIKPVDGPCSCCPYGYHIDLTFLGFMAEKDNAEYLSKLKKIKRKKRDLRKSLEVQMQSQNSENRAPDVVQDESLLSMVEQDEKATQDILSEIDSSVSETIDSIDNLMKAGPPKKRTKPSEPCDSDFSSGPQTTSSPRPTQSLNTTGSTSSLSSVDSNDKKVISKTHSENTTSSSHTEHLTTTTTNIITTHQITKSMEDSLNETEKPATDPAGVITPEQLQAIRDQMKMSLQRMRELEEQVKAIPVMQVRLSVLKEEKRLLMLQLEAEKTKKVEAPVEKPMMRSVGTSTKPKKTKSLGVGDYSIDDIDSTSSTGRRSRSQSPSGRSFEITEFQSYRRSNLTPMNKYFVKSSSGRSTPVSSDAPDVVDSAIGDGDVTKIYYIQPDIVTEAQFAMEMNALRPDHVPELVRPVDKEQEEFDALERALMDEDKMENRRPLMTANERSESFLRPTPVYPQNIEESISPTFVKPVAHGQVPIIKDGILKQESLYEEESMERSFAPIVEDAVDSTRQPLAERPPDQLVLKKTSRTVGVGDGNVFEEPKPVVIKPVKPQTRTVGSMVHMPTRDVGVTVVSETPQKQKPQTRDIGVGIGDLEDMKLIETGEFGEYYHTVPASEEVLAERRKQFENQQMAVRGGYQTNQSQQRTIRTTSQTTYSERRNILLQEEKIKLAVREALQRSVKSVAIMCKMPSSDKGCSTDLIKKSDRGCGDDTLDVEVRPLIEIRSIGVDVKPLTMNKFTAIDKPFSYNAMTNTPIPQPKDKSTNTSKPLHYPAAVQTDKKHTYSVNCGTDMKVFMATEQIKNAAVNTDKPNTRSTETNTERKTLKSENYDFSIHFRDGAANTTETCIKDLQVTDRGQNTMKPEDRDREIESRRSSENLRTVSASSNGFDGAAAGSPGGGGLSSSHEVTTRTVRYETSPRVIVNRHTVGGGFSGSGDSTGSSDETVTRSATGGLQMGSNVTGMGLSQMSASGRITGSSGSGSMGLSSVSVSGGGVRSSLNQGMESTQMSVSGRVTGSSSGSSSGSSMGMSLASVSGGGMRSSSSNVDQGTGRPGMRTVSGAPFSDSSRGVLPERDTITSEVSSELSSAPGSGSGASVVGGSSSSHESVQTLSSSTSQYGAATSGGGGGGGGGGGTGSSGVTKPSSLDLSGVTSYSSTTQVSTTRKVSSGEGRTGHSKARRSSSENAIQEMLGGGKAEISATKATIEESGVDSNSGASMGVSAQGMVIENKAAFGSSSGVSSGVGSQSGFMSQSSSGGMLNSQGNQASLTMTSGGGSLSVDSGGSSTSMGGGASSLGGSGSLAVSISGGERAMAPRQIDGRRVLVSGSESVTTYSSSGSSCSSDMSEEDRLASLRSEADDSKVEARKGDDNDMEQSQSDVFGQENNGTLIRKHIVTRSSIPVRSVQKEVRIQRTVDQNGNEGPGRFSPLSPRKEAGFGHALRSFGSNVLTSIGLQKLNAPSWSSTIAESQSEVTQTSQSLSPKPQTSEITDSNSGMRSLVSGGEIGNRSAFLSSFDKQGSSSGQSRTVVESTVERTSSGQLASGLTSESESGLRLQGFGSGNQVSISSTSSPRKMHTVVEGSTEITHSSSSGQLASGLTSESDSGLRLKGFGSGNQISISSPSSSRKMHTVVEGSTEITHSSSSSGEKDLEVLAQLKELEKDIEASHAKHLESMQSKDYDSSSLEADIEASHAKHFENVKSKFLSGSLGPRSVGDSTSDESQSYLSTGAISLLPATTTKLSSSSVTMTVGSSAKPAVAEGEDLEASELQEDDEAYGDESPDMTKSVSEGSLDRSESLGGSTGSLRSIMKRSGSFEGNKGQKKELKFAVGTMGGFDLNPELKTACEQYGDHLAGEKSLSDDEQKSHLSTIQTCWFKVSSERLSNPHEVEDYLSSINEISHGMLPLVINLVDANGNSAMHYAVSHCNFDIVSLLLDTEQCDINAQNRAGYTPIMLASLAQVQTDRYKEVVRRLFREGDVNIKATQAGQTALMLSVSHGKKDMVKLLLDCGADINAQDEDGSTALMCASEHGHTDIVKVLLAQPECDPSIVDQDGSTALAIAMEAGHRDIAVLLYAKRGSKSTVRSPVSPSEKMKEMLGTQ